MDLQLNGRRALVTGSTGGIGYAIARGLAAEGADVVVNGRTQARVDDAVARIAADCPGAKVGGVAADCGTADGAAAVVAAVPTVDILVNNLGIYGRKELFELEDADWTNMFEVNVMSGIRFARAYAPAMKAQGWGRVLFVSSESALNIPVEMAHYGMTKTAQLAVSRAYAMELAETGVTVNALLPGPTRTENTERIRAERAAAAGIPVAKLEADFFANFRPTSLTRKFHESAEVAHLAVFLCSPLAAATTGAALRVDGGTVNQIM